MKRRGRFVLLTAAVTVGILLSGVAAASGEVVVPTQVTAFVAQQVAVLQAQIDQLVGRADAADMAIGDLGSQVQLTNDAVASLEERVGTLETAAGGDFYPEITAETEMVVSGTHASGFNWFTSQSYEYFQIYVNPKVTQTVAGASGTSLPFQGLLIFEIPGYVPKTASMAGGINAVWWGTYPYAISGPNLGAASEAPPAGTPINVECWITSFDGQQIHWTETITDWTYSTY